MPSENEVKTAKVADRRQLSFTCMADILADVEMLDAAEKQGKEITATGNWSPAQIIEHVMFFVDGSMDGFDFKAPLLIRIIGKLIRSRILIKSMSPGIKLPPKMSMVLPHPKSNWQDAVTHSRQAILRVEAGKIMDQRSPLLGNMNHEDWVNMHCRHAEMHFSFIKVQ